MHLRHLLEKLTSKSIFKLFRTSSVNIFLLVQRCYSENNLYWRLSWVFFRNVLFAPSELSSFPYSTFTGIHDAFDIYLRATTTVDREETRLRLEKQFSVTTLAVQTANRFLETGDIMPWDHGLRRYQCGILLEDSPPPRGEGGIFLVTDFPIHWSTPCIARGRFVLSLTSLTPTYFEFNEVIKNSSPHWSDYPPPIGLNLNYHTACYSLAVKTNDLWLPTEHSYNLKVLWQLCSNIVYRMVLLIITVL